MSAGVTAKAAIPPAIPPETKELSVNSYSCEYAGKYIAENGASLIMQGPKPFHKPPDSLAIRRASKTLSLLFICPTPKVPMISETRSIALVMTIACATPAAAPAKTRELESSQYLLFCNRYNVVALVWTFNVFSNAVATPLGANPLYNPKNPSSLAILKTLVLDESFCFLRDYKLTKK